MDSPTFGPPFFSKQDPIELLDEPTFIERYIRPAVKAAVAEDDAHLIEVMKRVAAQEVTWTWRRVD